MFYKTLKQNPSSLLQIAVRDATHKEEVFVLDLLTMPPKMYNSALSEIFLSKSIVKLGQGFYQDLKELALSYPKASCFRVAKSVVEVNDLSISLVGGHHPLSLQKLVFLYLHRKLTKTQQTSNWNRRPLAASQLHYAAADALVLIHLYDELMKRINVKLDSFQLDSVMNVLDVHVPPAPKCNLCFESFDSANALKTHRKVCIQNVRTLEICVSCDEKKLVTPEAMQQHVSECSEAGSDDASRVVVMAKRTTAPRKRALSVTEAETAPPMHVTPPSKGALVAAPPQKQKAKRQKSVQMQNQRAEVLNAIQSLQNKKKQDPTQAKGNSAPPVGKLHPTQQHQAPPTSASSNGTATSFAQSKKKRKQRKKAKAVEVLQTAETKSNDAALPLKQRKMSVESSLLASDDIWSKVSTDQSSSLFSP